MISKLRLLRLAGLTADARLASWIMRLIDRNVVFLLHALDEFFDQLIELPVGHHLLDLLAEILVEHLAIEQRLLDRALQIVERVLVLRAFRTTWSPESRSAAGSPRARRADLPCSSRRRGQARIWSSECVS